MLRNSCTDPYLFHSQQISATAAQSATGNRMTRQIRKNAAAAAHGPGQGRWRDQVQGHNEGAGLGAAQPPPPSVFLFLVESLSRVNAHVQLPRTVQVLQQRYNATLLQGMVKVRRGLRTSRSSALRTSPGRLPSYKFTRLCTPSPS